jgi:thiol-disulfide isomerase/thioredoxin
MNIFRKQWERYSRKKRWWSIVLDFIFMLLVLGMLFPGTRRPLSAFFIRYTLFSPSDSQNVIYLSDQDQQLPLLGPGGEQIGLNQFKGKTVFLNFWATWCPPCIAEMPSIQRLYDEYGDEVVFVLVSNESREVTEAFMKKQNFTLPLYTLRGRVPEVFDVSTIPATFLIGPNGRILINKTGAAKWDSKKVKTMIDELIR